MSQPRSLCRAVIAVASTGSPPREADNPALPVTVAEQIEATHRAFEAGATLAHIHLRSSTGTRPRSSSTSPGAVKRNGVLPEIGVFDLSHFHGSKRLIDTGLMDERRHGQFVMGATNAMPADEHLLDVLLAEQQRILPRATWTAAGTERHQSEPMGWALAGSADAVRTGLEDNIRVARDRLASGNAELATIATEAIARHGRRVAAAL